MTKKRETWSYVNKWYIIVPLLYLAIVFLAPLLKMLYMSFFEFQGVGQDLGAFTLENYLRFITDAYYWKVLGLSVLLSFISCIFCVIMGYPVAYKIARMQGRAKSILTVIVVLPLWVSITVRMFGWMSVLSENGLLDMLVHVFNPQGDSISPYGNLRKRSDWTDSLRTALYDYDIDWSYRKRKPKCGGGLLCIRCRFFENLFHNNHTLNLQGYFIRSPSGICFKHCSIYGSGYVRKRKNHFNDKLSIPTIYVCL